MSFRAVLLLACAPVLMGAEVYRWVDADGVINYTERAPYGVKAEKIRMRDGGVTETVAPEPASPTPDTSTAGGQQLSPAQQQMLDDLRSAEQYRAEELARVRDANCKRSRDVLERLSTRGRIRVQGEDGEWTMMPEEERQRRINEAHEGITANCDNTSGG